MAHMSEAGDPFKFLPPSILANILGRVAHTRDIVPCRLASRALLAVVYQCPRIRLDASDRAPGLRKGGGGVEGTAFHTLAGNLASRVGSHLRSLVIIASEGQGCPDEATWVEEGEFDEADDLHVTSGNSVRAWAATAAGSALQELEIADFWPQSCWRKAEALPVISHFCRLEKLLVHLPPSDITDCPFVPLLRGRAPSCEVTVLFHADTTDAVRQAAASVWPPFVGRLPSFPEITWQWGTWQ
ncbi:hypothetical protein ZWY2020_032427 [Hordeum vulgare]|nr:hypothetical protein ZWY2020_032427 [Hordeum vulgare]